MIDLDRRSLMKAIATASALGILGEGVSPALADTAVQQAALKLGNPEPFSFDILKQQARDLAGLPYQAPMKPAPEIVKQAHLRGMGQDHVQYGRSSLRRRPRALPGDLLPPRHVLR